MNLISYYPGKGSLAGTNPSAVGEVPDNQTVSLGFGGKIVFQQSIVNYQGNDFSLFFTKTNPNGGLFCFLDVPNSLTLHPVTVQPSSILNGVWNYDISNARDFQTGLPVNLNSINYLTIYTPSGLTELDAIALTVPEPSATFLLIIGFLMVFIMKKLLTFPKKSTSL